MTNLSIASPPGVIAQKHLSVMMSVTSVVVRFGACQNRTMVLELEYNIVNYSGKGLSRL